MRDRRSVLRLSFPSSSCLFLLLPAVFDASHRALWRQHLTASSFRDCHSGPARASYYW